MPQVVVEAEFVERQDVNKLDIFREVVDAWYLLASKNGFVDFNAPLTEHLSITIENDLQITSIGMQVVFDKVMIAEAGFHVFINMFTFFHHSVAPLYRVSIS